LEANTNQYYKYFYHVYKLLALAIYVTLFPPNNKSKESQHEV